MVSRDPDRRAAAFAVLARGSVGRHPWDWTPDSACTVTAIPGDPPRLRRGPPATSFLGQILRRLVRHPEAHPRAFSLDQADLPPASGDWRQRISVILLLPAWPVPEDLAHLDHCATALQQAPPRTVSGCVIAVEDVLAALAPPPPPVDALHAWSHIRSNRPLNRDSEPGQAPAEATARAWRGLAHELDQVWGGRLQGIIATLREHDIPASVGPVNLSVDGLGMTAPFNLPWLLDRATVQPTRFSIGTGSHRRTLIAGWGEV